MNDADKIALLRATVKESGDMFRHYEALHLAKGTRESREKANVNAKIAKLCEEAYKVTA